VQTDTAPRQTDTVKFALRAVAWSLGFFGLLRLNWFAAHVLLPVTRFQATAAAGVLGTPTMPIEVTLACSGADALALCLGTILAYPVRWRARIAGAAGGAALILVLNTLRIGTLGQAAATPSWFNILHLYVWPGFLLLAIAGYVFMWMRVADGGVRKPGHVPSTQPTRRFVVLTAVFLIVFAAAAPIYLESSRLLVLAGFIARAAASILGTAGITAYATSNVLWTPRGGFLVTQECISTPLVPVYLAAICTYSTTRRRLFLGVLATIPLFVALGIVRLLVVALPGVVSSPLFFVHAFYQLLLGAVVVFIAALWRHGGRTAIAHATAGAVVGILFVYLLGPAYTRAVSLPGMAALDDPQGAIAFLPAFQIALYLALWVAAAFAAISWRRFAAGLAVLGLTQSAGLLALHTLAIHAGVTAHVRDIRGWAVAGPVLIFAAVLTSVRTPR
jgi:exosortase/archaeosortase family protein